MKNFITHLSRVICVLIHLTLLSLVGFFYFNNFYAEIVGILLFSSLVSGIIFGKWKVATSRAAIYCLIIPNTLLIIGFITARLITIETSLLKALPCLVFTVAITTILNVFGIICQEILERTVLRVLKALLVFWQSGMIMMFTEIDAIFSVITVNMVAAMCLGIILGNARISEYKEFGHQLHVWYYPAIVLSSMLLITISCHLFGIKYHFHYGTNLGVLSSFISGLVGLLVYKLVSQKT